MAANDSFSDDLQCPVCLLVPREIPIPACPVGHLVCQSCRANVHTCPTCRRPMHKNGTNTLANKMIEKVPHPCKYSECQVKNYLKEIVKHEARCPERTIKCPFLSCNEQVKVTEYETHARTSKTCNRRSGVLSNTSNTFFEIENGKTIQSYLSTIWIGNWSWSMMAFEDRGKMFYFHQHFFSTEQTFAFYVTMAEHSSEAKKYLAKMTLKNQNDDRKFLIIIQDVISMDSAPSNKDAVLASKSVMLVHCNTMFGFMKISKETNENKETFKSYIDTTIDILFNWYNVGL